MQDLLLKIILYLMNFVCLILLNLLVLSLMMICHQKVLIAIYLQIYILMLLNMLLNYIHK